MNTCTCSTWSPSRKSLFPTRSGDELELVRTTHPLQVLQVLVTHTLLLGSGTHYTGTGHPHPTTGEWYALHTHCRYCRYWSPTPYYWGVVRTTHPLQVLVTHTLLLGSGTHYTPTAGTGHPHPTTGESAVNLHDISFRILFEGTFLFGKYSFIYRCDRAQSDFCIRVHSVSVKILIKSVKTRNTTIG